MRAGRGTPTGVWWEALGLGWNSGRGLDRSPSITTSTDELPVISFVSDVSRYSKTRRGGGFAEGSLLATALPAGRPPRHPRPRHNFASDRRLRHHPTSSATSSASAANRRRGPRASRVAARESARLWRAAGTSVGAPPLVGQMSPGPSRRRSPPPLAEGALQREANPLDPIILCYSSPRSSPAPASTGSGGARRPHRSSSARSEILTQDAQGSRRRTGAGRRRLSRLER